MTKMSRNVKISVIQKDTALSLSDTFHDDFDANSWLKPTPMAKAAVSEDGWDPPAQNLKVRLTVRTCAVDEYDPNAIGPNPKDPPLTLGSSEELSMERFS